MWPLTMSAPSYCPVLQRASFDVDGQLPGAFRQAPQTLRFELIGLAERTSAWPVAPCADQFRDFLFEVLADQDAVIFIAESQDQIIGLAYGYVRSLSEIPIRIPSPVGEVDHLGRAIGTGRQRQFEDGWGRDDGE